MLEQYLLQLMLSKGIGDAAIKKILAHIVACPQDSLESLCASPEQLSSIIEIRPGTINSINSNRGVAEHLAQELRRQGISILVETDVAYPHALKDTLGVQCPPVLFVSGNKQLLEVPAVGFCGSRKVSPKGASITEQCAEQLVDQKMTVVSGYASGTDLFAHTAALAHGGNTIFVLAEGILKYTKKQAIRDYLTSENHVFISQFNPTSPWSVGNAMKRNSLIIGLSQAMILVESGKSGGTFAAGEEALKRQLPLFVIDFEKPEVSAEANPYFIAHGGFPIRGKQGVPNLEKVFEAVRNKTENSLRWEQLSF